MNKAIAAFIRKELAQALRDPRMRAIIFVVPVIQLCLFGFAISNEVKNIRLATQAKAGDRVFFRLSERFYSSGWFIPAKGDGSPEELLASGRADAVLVAPEGGLEKRLGRGDAGIQLLIDAKNSVKARSIEKYSSAILAQFVKDSSGQGQNLPLAFDIRVLYNPSMETSYYMVPGVICMILSIISLILTSMAVAREKEMGTFETIIAAPLGKTEILIGKTFPFLLLGMFDSALLLGAGVLIFGVPIRGSLAMFFLACFIFLCVAVSIGLLISTISSNQQQAMMGSFLFVFPAVLMSGLMFPVENMPQAIQYLAWLNPLKYFVVLLRTITLKGDIVPVLALNMGILTAMGMVIIVTAARRFRNSLN